MPGPSGNTHAPPGDRSRALLDWVHAQLVGHADSQRRLHERLAALANAGACEAAGLAALYEDDARVSARVDFQGIVLPPELPWRDLALQREWWTRLRSARAPVTGRTDHGESLLVTSFETADGGRWLLWAEDEQIRGWSKLETAAFALAADALARGLSNEGSAASSELVRRQARLEQAAGVVHRLAHEFGNVLTGILGFSDLSLSLLAPDSPVHHYVAEIHQAARQGAELTQALRWFSRRGTAAGESSSLAEAVAREDERLRKECGPAVQFRASVADAIPPVAVDGEALRQVLRQVLENAREALPSRGSIALTTRTTELAESDCRQLVGGARPGLFVEVQVADNGSGFSAEVLERFFVEAFFSTKPRRRGLGLAIVYGILRSNHGGFAVANGLRGGAVVRLYFPVAAKPVPVAQTGGATDGHGADRVLVVDDDPMVLQLVCAALQREGYGVQVAASGAEALASYAAAGHEGFDLVLSDVLMPRMSGLDLARQLLRRDAEANVLFMSGQATADFPEIEFPRSRFDLLSKPFRPDGLLRAVRSALDRRPRRPRVASGDVGPVPHPASS